MRIDRLSAPTLVVFSLTLLLAACQRSTATDETESEGSGATVAEERIVTLVPSAAELVFALGAGDRMVGRSLHDDFPPEVQAIPSIGSGMNPDVEQILAMRPTLVVAGEMQADYPAISTLRGAGVEVLVLPDQSIADIATALGALGERLGRSEVATRLRQEVEAGLAAARPAPPPRPAPRVLVAVGTDPVYAAGDQTFIDTLVRNAGGENIVEGDWVRLDDETIVALAPDVIIQPADDDSELDPWNRFGASIPAVANNRLCAVSRDPIARPGPRVVTAAAEVAACIAR